MLMIIAILRRHEELGTAEGMFDERCFAIAESDLHWGLAYIFYSMMQTSAIYDRLHQEEKVEPKTVVRISPLALLSLLPNQFTTAAAVKQGEEMGVKPRTVKKHLYTLCTKGYIEHVRQGLYRKATRKKGNIRLAA
jgi:hypothetical protein